MSSDTALLTLLGIPDDPAAAQEVKTESTFGWATVTASSPLRIRKDGETDPLPMTPESIGGGLYRPGARVWCQFFGLRVFVFGTSAATTDTWHLAAFVTGWSNYGSGFELAGYTRTTGEVRLRGVCKGGAGNILLLPSGYAPAAAHQFVVPASGGVADIRVYSSGYVTLSGFLGSPGSSGSISLSQIRFPPSP